MSLSYPVREVVPSHVSIFASTAFQQTDWLKSPFNLAMPEKPVFQQPVLLFAAVLFCQLTLLCCCCYQGSACLSCGNAAAGSLGAGTGLVRTR